METTIRNARDLKDAYKTLSLYKEIPSITHKPLPEKAANHVKDIKIAIRAYNNRPKDRRIITGDYDGYMELITLPEYLKTKEEAEEYFDEYERLHAYPSAYDCTGQAFTCGEKVFERNGRFFCYHSVGFDV